MDRIMVEEKLESLRICVSRIQEKTPASAQALKQDLDRQDILVLNLTRAVQICVDIASHLLSESHLTTPITMAQSFSGLQELGVIGSATSEAMQQAVGFRNLAVHQYEAVDWEIVWDICISGPDELRGFCAEVREYLQRSGGSTSE